jgi:ribonuclease HII
MLDSFLQERRNIEWIIGIDEAGRGPIAGPVSVGGVLIPADFDAAFCVGIKDSKQLSAQLREEWFAKMHDHPSVHISVSLVGPDHIDKRGIVHAIKTAMRRVLTDLSEDIDPTTILVLLDGSLYAPRIYVHQETIIKGDEKVPVISMASIAAKVTRDRHMVKLAKKYPEYRFDKHKGYGTENHYKMLQEHGPSKMHRSSFIRLTK